MGISGKASEEAMPDCDLSDKESALRAERGVRKVGSQRRGRGAGCRVPGVQVGTTP